MPSNARALASAPSPQLSLTCSDGAVESRIQDCPRRGWAAQSIRWASAQSMAGLRCPSAGPSAQVARDKAGLPSVPEPVSGLRALGNNKLNGVTWQR